MKIIDLLNKIANGEEVPKKIRYKNFSYIYSNECKGYYLGTNPERIETFDCNRLYQRFSSGDMLNDEVEIIEDNKTDYIYHCCIEPSSEETKFLIQNINDLADKINEIIDKLNEENK